jgi:hypothetical protein
MSILWMDPALAALCTVGIGGSALGLWGLLHARPLRGRWSLAAAALMVLVAGAAAVAAWLGQAAGVWVPPLALVGVCAAFRFVRTAAARRLAGWLGAALREPRVQAAGLLLGSLLFALGWTLWVTDVPEPAGIESCLHLLGDDWNRDLVEVAAGTAWTDRGRAVRPRTSKNAPPFTEELRAKQTALLRHFQLQEHVISLPNPDQDCNCHGWVFTGGRYWLSPDDVELILQDNRYQQVSQPQAGDLVVYRDPESKKIIHTGLLRLADGPLLVESKWGVLGRFLHPHDSHCYGEPDCQFYRSDRPGHLLRGLPGAPDTAGVTVAAGEQGSKPLVTLTATEE